jgi:hypothetical protein
MAKKFRAPYSSNESPAEVARGLSRSKTVPDPAGDPGPFRPDGSSLFRGRKPSAATIDAERAAGIGNYSSTATVHRSGRRPVRTGQRGQQDIAALNRAARKLQGGR